MNLSDQEFLNKMKENSHEDNLKELERRNIKNNLHVLKYLLEIQNISSLRYQVNRCLLQLFDPFHRSIEIFEHPNLKITLSNFVYKTEKVVHSINKSSLSKDFITFVKLLEYLLYKCLYKHKFKLSSRDNSLLRKTKADFFFVVDRIKHKSNSKREFLHFKEINSFFFKESWLFMLKNIYFLERISFVLDFYDEKKISSNIYKLFVDTEKRYTNYLEEGFPESEIIVNDEEDRNVKSTNSKFLSMDYEVYEINETVKNEKRDIFKGMIKKEEKLMDSNSLTWHLRRNKFK